MTYHCEKCNDTGVILYEVNGYQYAKICECQKVRKALENAEKSGLGELLKVYTFDRFKTDYGFQKDLYNKAKEYIKDESSKWFGVFGKSGSGKSHIPNTSCFRPSNPKSHGLKPCQSFFLRGPSMPGWAEDYKVWIRVSRSNPSTS